jgi:hypothetical protein
LARREPALLLVDSFEARLDLATFVTRHVVEDLTVVFEQFVARELSLSECLRRRIASASDSVNPLFPCELPS